MLIKLIIIFVAIATTFSAVPGIVPINCTRPFEEYQCGSACQTYCATLGDLCPIVNKKCQDACYCIPNYARNATGDCIPQEDCPPKISVPFNCTRSFEIRLYQCGGACQTECATLGNPCPVMNIPCNYNCYCIPGYARNATGDCIPQEDCPPKYQTYP